MTTPSKKKKLAAAPACTCATTGAPNLFRALDHAKEAWIAQLTNGLSPASMGLALADWLIHLSMAPGKQLELGTLALQSTWEMSRDLQDALQNPGSTPLSAPWPGDSRFRDAGWQEEPYRFYQQAFMHAQQWWEAATSGVPGTTPHHEDVVAFCARQWLDMCAPANFLPTNPQVVRRTVETLGMNLVQGTMNALDDMHRQSVAAPAAGVEKFKVGIDVAVTPGKVVFRNHLIELIQYGPSTAEVAAEPVLIVPAWIMKYYILDLSPHNSLVRYLVGQGYTVFCISWRNVTAEDRDLGLDDYRRLGVVAALDAIAAITPGRRVHASGYCLGGTLLSIAAAALEGAGQDRLASITLFAAQTDFSEPGELQLFIDDSEVYFLESLMWAQGYLMAKQMSGAFQMLQSKDLIWSQAIRSYMLGERVQPSDLMAWNADSTRMPYRMHSEYLRQLFLNNDLSNGRFNVEGRPLSLRNIGVPLFVVGTESDHIAPWKSVYKIHQLCDTDVTFVLTSGGHNAGIVSEPGHPGRHFRIKRTGSEDLRIGPDEWAAAAKMCDGSWWPEWIRWLKAHGSPKRVAPPRLGPPGSDPATFDEAPGHYVRR
ncbi:alpha/beta hydrolase [Bordetella sp. FB-8]|uniref:PHA/PHB synthase family protein n=1 Tax=Bordetella sp. FB-8 TaxID=1159870 RepID=UPI000370A601|nr:alpha/beta fold hydrolase [Bordetella sp. FB-8]